MEHWDRRNLTDLKEVQRGPCYRPPYKILDSYVNPCDGVVGLGCLYISYRKHS